MRITTEEARNLRTNHLAAAYAAGRAEEHIEANEPDMTAAQLLTLLKGDVAEAVGELQDAGLESWA